MTDIIAKPETAVSTEVNFLDDVEIPSSELRIPRLTIVSAMSDSFKKEGAKIGTWHNSVTKQSGNEWIDLVIFSVSFGAVYLKQGEGLVCKSADRILSINGAPCSECPFDAHYDKWDGSDHPLCAKTIDFIALDVAENFPCLISCKVSAYKAGQDILTQLKMFQMSRKTKVIKLGVKTVSGKKGDYGVPIIKTAMDITPDVMKSVEYWNRMYKANKLSVDAEETEASSDDTDPFK